MARYAARLMEAGQGRAELAARAFCTRGTLFMSIFVQMLYVWDPIACQLKLAPINVKMLGFLEG